MLKKPFFKIVAGCFAAMTVSISGANEEFMGPDLTGTWVGNMRCKGVDNYGPFSVRFKRAEMKITQYGTDLNLLLHLNEGDGGPTGSAATIFNSMEGYLFNGAVVPENGAMPLGLDEPAVGGPALAQATIIRCDTQPFDNYHFGEMGRFHKIKINDVGGTSIFGTSILGGVFGSATCTWNKFQRVEMIDPVVPECDGVPVPVNQ